MLRTTILSLLALGLLAAAPAPAMACPLGDCVPPVVVCQDLIPLACFEIDPEEAIDWESVRDLLGPCTCDPVD